MEVGGSDPLELLGGPAKLKVVPLYGRGRIKRCRIGAFLDKTSFRRYKVKPDYAPYAWPPNGYANLGNTSTLSGPSAETWPDGMKPWPADNIDPIEELARIINGAQDRDAS